MAMLVRSEHGLPTLRIRLARSKGRAAPLAEQAVWEAVVGAGEPREFFRCDTAELGLPDRVDSTRSVSEDRFRLPPDAAGSIARAVAEMDAGGAGRDAVWLELPAPRGYLHLAPWEKLLASAVPDRPMLRLPYHTLRPRASSAIVEVAVCGVVPRAGLAGVDPSAIIAAHARSWILNAGLKTRVHVFTRDEAVAGVRRLVEALPDVVVHDPEQARDLPASGLARDVSPTDLATNPWLLWMTAALGGQALDIVHVLTQGNLSGTGGRMLIARSPIAGDERDTCLLVGPTPLSGGLSQLGAWALVLSGLPGDPCPAGLRDLADAIAQLRPGVAVAGGPTGSDTTDLDAALRRLFGDGSPPGRPLPTLSCWIHPQFVEYAPEECDALLLTTKGHSTVIAPATQDALAAQDTPAWVAAGTRYLELQQADWLDESTVDTGTDDAAVSALRSVSALLDAHVRKMSSTRQKAR
jgi:hypothetical protein